LLGITTDNASLNYSMMCEQQSFNWDLLNQVACIETPYTMHGERHTATFRWIHEQSWCKRPYEVLAFRRVQSAIWREWKQSHQENSKTSERGKCYNQEGVSHETRFSEDNWEGTYFMIFWTSWHWPS
jgi:hypothetical protein